VTIPYSPRHWLLTEVNSQGRGDNKLGIPEYTVYKYFIIPKNIRLIVEWFVIMYSHIACNNLYFINFDVMVSVLSSSAVGRLFETPSGHAKPYNCGLISCFQFIYIEKFEDTKEGHQVHF
jgi:hypothetical protein